MSREQRRICVVTGTRAEFGLLRSTLQAIDAHPKLQLQLIVTGMHLDPSRGKTIDQIRDNGWKIAKTIPWPPAKRATNVQAHAARCTGRAVARLTDAYTELKSDIILVVGDRVEAFAAAAAAHVSGRLVAHIHGGDRAQGLVDDALRHAITKLAHVHFPATRQSAQRIVRLGEQPWRVHRVGSPGLDDIRAAQPWEAVRERFPALQRRRYALLVVHPESADESDAERLAETLLAAIGASGISKLLAVLPNNDPGAAGIVRRLTRAAATNRDMSIVSDLPRHAFLALLRDAALLIGNSSSGIIEAASFGTPVIDVGARQRGRERGGNVTTVPIDPTKLGRAIDRIWRDGRPIRFPRRNLYGGGHAGEQIARTLADLDIARHVPKLIRY